jgi:hypothetical protein
VAGEGQGHALGNPGEQVGIVGEGDQRRPLGKACEDRLHVRFHLPHVADAHQPELETVSREPAAFVLEGRDPGRLEGQANDRRSVPVVVVSQDGEHSERSLELREDRRSGFRRNDASSRNQVTT